MDLRTQMTDGPAPMNCADTAWISWRFCVAPMMDGSDTDDF